MLDKKEIEEEINEVEYFTNSYWYPMLKVAEENTDIDTPNFIPILREIIDNRDKYVSKLKSLLT
jgi:hypothetical protein